jgi:3-dehydrosphinganine reductase
MSLSVLVDQNYHSSIGKSSPDMFLDIDLDVFEGEMKLNYLGSAYTAREAAKQMVANKTKGKIVLASSILGLFGMVGYSSYTPTKFAIRGEWIHSMTV